MPFSWAVRIQSQGRRSHPCRRSCSGCCCRTRSRACGHNHRCFHGRHHHGRRHRHFHESRKEVCTHLVLGRIPSPFSHDGLIVVLAHPWSLPTSYWAGIFGSSSWCWARPRVHSLRRCRCWSHHCGVSSVWDQSWGMRFSACLLGWAHPQTPVRLPHEYRSRWLGVCWTWDENLKIGLSCCWFGSVGRPQDRWSHQHRGLWGACSTWNQNRNWIWCADCVHFRWRQ